MSTVEEQQAQTTRAYHLCLTLPGMKTDDAIRSIEVAGLTYRYLRVDGMSMMITADCRMNRIGLDIEKGIVTKATQG